MKFLWRFVDGKTQVNHCQHQSEIPIYTFISNHLFLALKKHGFKFVDSTIYYAFMQATGVVNDHLSDCICRQKKTSNKKIIMLNL
ncbi:MAG: DNA-3-methyladenine glycosylase I [Candidatus Phlomobacter fragariae]